MIHNIIPKCYMDWLWGCAFDDNYWLVWPTLAGGFLILRSF